MQEAIVQTIQYMIDKYLKGVLDIDAESLIISINDITYCTSLKGLETISKDIVTKGKR